MSGPASLLTHLDASGGSLTHVTHKAESKRGGGVSLCVCVAWRGALSSPWCEVSRREAPSLMCVSAVPPSAVCVVDRLVSVCRRPGMSCRSWCVCAMRVQLATRVSFLF